MSGFRPALGQYSEDEDEARRSLRDLRMRLVPFDVDSVCTSHLKCSAATPEFWADLLDD